MLRAGTLDGRDYIATLDDDHYFRCTYGSACPIGVQKAFGTAEPS